MGLFNLIDVESEITGISFDIRTDLLAILKYGTIIPDYQNRLEKIDNKLLEIFKYKIYSVSDCFQWLFHDNYNIKRMNTSFYKEYDYTDLKLEPIMSDVEIFIKIYKIMMSISYDFVINNRILKISEYYENT